MTYVIMPEPCGPDSGQDPAACAEAAQEEDYSGDYGTPYSYYPAPSPPFYSGPAVAPVLPAKPITPPRQPAPPPRPKPIKAPRPTPSCPKGAKNCSLNKLKSWAPP